MGPEKNPLFSRARIIAWLFFLGIRTAVFSQGEADTTQAPYKGSFFPSPSIVYAPETDWVVGAFLLWQFKVPGAGPETRSSNASFWVASSLKEQVFLELRHSIFTKGEKYFLEGHFFSKFFTEVFYGLGPDSREEDGLALSYDSYEFQQRVLRKVKPFMFLGPQYRYILTENVEFKDEQGQDVQLPELPGSRGSTESGLGLAFTADRRNSILTPTENSYLEVSTFYYGGYLGGDHNFFKLLVNARKYFGFDTEGKHVLAFEGLLNVTSGEVPFRELSSLGGNYINRGFYEGRYRDKNSLQVQAEYRLNVYRRFGVVGFAALGQVNDRLEDMFSRTVYSAGFGLRYNINRRDPANIRIDFGFTGESQGVYIGFGEAF